MYFITETELRMRYRSSHFSEYTIKKGTRLTPEARQFLLDRTISIGEQLEEPQAVEIEETQKQEHEKIASSFKLKLEKISASFLLMISFLVDEDMYTAEQVMILGNCLADLCSETTNKSLDTLIDSCAETEKKHTITGFHIQSPKGKEIALLNFLLVDLNLFRLELIGDSDKKDTMEKEQSILLNQRLQKVCCVLEGLIHKAIGGKSDYAG